MAQSKRKDITNPRNIYRVRTGWYLQIQWVDRIYRELFSDSTYGGREPALAKAITNRDWLNKFRTEHEECVRALEVAESALAGSKAGCDRAMAKLTKAVGAKCVTKADRELFHEYFSLEPAYANVSAR